jgi:hypothetical protein
LGQVDGDMSMPEGAVRGHDGGDENMSPTYLMLGREPQFADVRVSLGWSSRCQEESLTRWYAEPTVTCQRQDGYITAGAGSVVQMDTDAKAVEELLTCSGRAGCVRGFCF